MTEKNKQINGDNCSISTLTKPLTNAISSERKRDPRCPTHLNFDLIESITSNRIADRFVERFIKHTNDAN